MKTEFKKGQHPSKFTEFKKGELNRFWKGDGAACMTKHAWLRDVFGKADHCSFDSSHTSHHFEWANISGSYLRDIDDWAQLCIKCHRNYDMIRSSYQIAGKSAFKVDGGDL